MSHPEQYFKIHNLYNIDSLRAHSAHNSVDVITSPKFPNLVMLHYSREAQTESNWNPFSRMSRGLIVDMENKRVLARPFDKFFNINEQAETKLDRLLNIGPFHVSEKLDGSMLILFRDPKTKKYHFTTKGSFESDHGKYATSIMPEILKNEYWTKDYTFMFELITYKKDLRKNLVIDYEKKGYPEGVYLIGARHNISGLLVPYKQIQKIAQESGLQVFHTYQFGSLEEVLQNTKRLPVLEEGYVLHFPEVNLLVKLKGEDYKRAHKFISKLSPTYLLEGLMVGTEKDLINIAPEEYRDDVVKQIDNYRKQRKLLVDKCYSYFNEAPKDSRKTFALWVNNNVEGCLRGFLFSLLDSKPIQDWKVYKTIGRQEGLSPRYAYEKS